MLEHFPSYLRMFYFAVLLHRTNLCQCVKISCFVVHGIHQFNTGIIGNQVYSLELEVKNQWDCFLSGESPPLPWWGVIEKSEFWFFDSADKIENQQKDFKLSEENVCHSEDFLFIAIYFACDYYW